MFLCLLHQCRWMDMIELFHFVFEEMIYMKIQEESNIMMQNYWLNYYKIRKLTLHDFATGISLADRFDFDNGKYR